MNGITLRAPGTPLDGRPLGEGMHDIGGAGIRVDRRGHWLLVDEAGTGAHVNGRPVRRLALLRPGDSVHIGGRSILLEGGRPAPAPAVPAGAGDTVADARVLLRGIGGRHHGRGFSLERPLVVGSDAGADIRLDPPVATRHARIGLEGGRVVLRDIGGGDVAANGIAVRGAELSAGDQLLFGSRDRFVLEAPCEPPAAFEGIEHADAAAPSDVASRPMHRLPWLLLVALLIAALLSGLLLL